MATATASSPSQVADAITDYIASRLEAALSDYMTEKQANMWQIISVPVQYMDAFGRLSIANRRRPQPIGPLPGPGATQRTPPQRLIVRSKKGESPRKEFGNYYESMKVVVRRQGDVIVGELGTDIRDGRATRLEFDLDRPHFRTIYARMRQELPGALMRYMQ